MRTLMLTFVALFISSLAVAEPAASFKLSEQATEKLLSAARQIKPQTGPAYFVNGAFKCTETAWEVPPYKAVATCTLWIDGKKVEIKKAEPILWSLQDVKPMTGPYYSVKGAFSANSISREFPPYDVQESAEVSLAN